jgi:hypothetical protein
MSSASAPFGAADVGTEYPYTFPRPPPVPRSEHRSAIACASPSAVANDSKSQCVANLTFRGDMVTFEGVDAIQVAEYGVRHRTAPLPCLESLGNPNVDRLHRLFSIRSLLLLLSQGIVSWFPATSCGGNLANSLEPSQCEL